MRCGGAVGSACCAVCVKGWLPSTPFLKLGQRGARPVTEASLGAPRMSEPCTPEALLEAVRGLRVAEPDLGFKPLLAKLQA